MRSKWDDKRHFGTAHPKQILQVPLEAQLLPDRFETVWSGLMPKKMPKKQLVSSRKQYGNLVHKDLHSWAPFLQVQEDKTI